MSQPQPFQRTYSYTNSFAANPTQVFPGNALDTELNNIKATTDQVLQNLTLLQNDDGTVRNGSIGPAQLSASLQLGFTVPTAWAPGQSYTSSPASTVFENSAFYSCLISHTSGVFATDLAAGKWVLIANLAAIPLVNASQIDIVPSGGIVAGDVQDAMYGLDTRITASSALIATNTAALNNITSTQITDATATGRALMTAASADAALAEINGFSTGDVKLTIKTVADPGWLMMNDQTIGSALSGATYANADAQNLYTLLWNNITNTYAPVTGGRGGSAAADWAANKPIQLCLVLGRALAVAGSGSGLTAATLGENTGANTVTLAQANLGASWSFPNSGITIGPASPIPPFKGFEGNYSGSGTGAPLMTNQLANANATSDWFINDQCFAISAQGSASSNGSGTPVSVMQPTSFLNVMMKK